MKSRKLLFSTPLIIEFLADRGVVENIEDIDEILKDDRVQGFVTEACMRSINYLFAEILGVPELVDDFKKVFEPIAVNYTWLQKVTSSVADTRSAIEIDCATQENIDAIVTHKPQDFEGSTIPIVEVCDLRKHLNLNIIRERPDLERIFSKNAVPAVSLVSLVNSYHDLSCQEKPLEKKEISDTVTHSKTRGKIALISVHDDPAIDIGKEEAGRQNVYVRKVGEALARLGWQVDMFTRCSDTKQEKIVNHSFNCRTIRLTAGPEEFIDRQNIFDYLPKFLVSFFQFQHEQQSLYPIVHTYYWLSGWVGMEVKKRQSIRHLHTYHSLGAVEYRQINTIPLIAKTHLRIDRQCLETADMIIATSPQEKQHMRALVSKGGSITVISQTGENAREGVESRFSWDDVASQLDQQYLSELNKLYQELGLLSASC